MIPLYETVPVSGVAQVIDGNCGRDITNQVVTVMGHLISRKYAHILKSLLKLYSFNLSLVSSLYLTVF